MFYCKMIHRFRTSFLIFIYMNELTNGLRMNRMQFFKSKYFDERSIHADIGRDMNVVSNHVKAFNLGKTVRENNKRLYDKREKDVGKIENVRQGYEARDENELPGNSEQLEQLKMENSDVKLDALDGSDRRENILQDCGALKKENEQFDAGPTNIIDEKLNDNDINSLYSSELKNSNNVHKRETVATGSGNKHPSNEEHIAESQKPHALPDQAKRYLNVPKLYVKSDDGFRKQVANSLKGPLINTNHIRTDLQYPQNYQQISDQDLQKSDSRNVDNVSLEHPMYDHNIQVPNAQPVGVYFNDKQESEQNVDTENQPMLRLFEKQRQIENLKQLLLQVESKFQMEVNEVGRLQQSVAEAEDELNDAVRIMQEVKLKNIKGLQDIEAAQNAAGRNLESKALKAHAEESQLAMHDQILFSERQRLNALRAQMIYLQTELASVQNPTISLEDNVRRFANIQSNAFHYKSPLAESMKYYQLPQNKRPYFGHYYYPNDHFFRNISQSGMQYT